MNWAIAVFMVLLAVAGSSSCRKQAVLTVGGILKFDTDTLKFDTVFTAAGSFTRGMLIYNPQNEPIVISSVRLKAGNSSYFHLNVDGFQGNNISNLKVAAHDSIYVFATVNINPNDTTTPFLVVDYLIATLNGKDFTVPFTAYGQNAHYVVSDSFSANTTWLTDKPYVVVHSCVVGPNTTLTIPSGCRVYMHQDARFFVYGNLLIDPTATAVSKDSVVFQGDRLDRVYFGYQGYPGEWGGFYFVNGSTGNFKNAMIKNCGGSTPYYNYAIQSAAIEVDSGAKLTMARTTVKNSIGHGVFGFQGAVTATNCLITNCGGEALAIALGGVDTFTNCTFTLYGSDALTHADNPTVGIVNWLQITQTQYIYSNLNVVLRNCIVWGSLDSELVTDTSGTAASAGGASLHTNIIFDHCIVKKPNLLEGFTQLTGCLNTDPLFKNAAVGDFHLTTGSSAVNTGNNAYVPPSDLEGTIRSGSDAGCYQH